MGKYYCLKVYFILFLSNSMEMKRGKKSSEIPVLCKPRNNFSLWMRFTKQLRSNLPFKVPTSTSDIGTSGSMSVNIWKDTWIPMLSHSQSNDADGIAHEPLRTRALPCQPFMSDLLFMKCNVRNRKPVSIMNLFEMRDFASDSWCLTQHSDLKLYFGQMT